MSIEEIIEEYGYERYSGRIMFRSPAYKLICTELGIKWSSLTRTGKASLRGSMINQFTGESPIVNERGDYYVEL